MLKNFFLLLFVVLGVSLSQPSFAGFATKPINPKVTTVTPPVLKNPNDEIKDRKPLKSLFKKSDESKNVIRYDRTEADAKVNFWVLGGGIAALMGGLLMMISGSVVAIIAMGLVAAFSTIILLYFLAGGRVPKFLLKGNQES